MAPDDYFPSTEKKKGGGHESIQPAATGAPLMQLIGPFNPPVKNRKINTSEGREGPQTDDRGNSGSADRTVIERTSPTLGLQRDTITAREPAE